MYRRAATDERRAGAFISSAEVLRGGVPTIRVEPVSDSALYERPAAPPREKDYLSEGEL